jgi:hypothetical protein
MYSSDTDTRRLHMNVVRNARVAVFGLLLALPAGAMQQAQQAPRHHSKLKGAVAGAAVGHVLGGHAKAGAVAGVIVQHHRNKKAAKGG